MLASDPQLLDDKECLNTVLEITELAMSGAKSRKGSSECPAYKEDKKLSPVSLRVSCAAEELLSSILQRVGHSSDSCSPEELFINNPLDEEHVASDLGNVACDPWFRPTEGFKYYLCDDNLIIAVTKECNLTSEELSSPVSSTVILRGPSGKTSWQFKQNNIPVSNPCQQRSPCKKEPEKNNNDHTFANKQSFKISNKLPKVDMVKPSKIDKAVPELESQLSDENSNLEELILTNAAEEAKLPTSPTPLVSAASPPAAVTSLQTARMVLAQLGLLHPLLTRDQADMQAMFDIVVTDPQNHLSVVSSV